MKRVGRLNDDRISQLPQDVIHEILMLLPIKDAAKTAFMSTQWRCHWRSIPQLVFDDDFAPITEPSMRKKMKKMKKVILNVYKSLLAHDGPVAKFVLAIYELVPCDEIDYIILHLSGRGVQEFTLKFSCRHYSRYKVPSSLFTALQLNRLELEHCLFMVPPWFVGFSKLTVLHLDLVSLPSDFYTNFLPKCPLLEDLKLVLCKGPAELELDAPRLQVFHFVGQLLKIHFKHTPLLSELRYNVYGLQKPDFVALFASLPILQELVVDCKFLDVLGKGCHIPCRLPTPLCRLRNLHIGVFDVNEHVLFCLIMSSPNLHTLTIQSGINKLVTGIGGLFEAKHLNGSCLQYLKVFTIENSFGAPLELELLRFILATAPQLVRIQIKPSHVLPSRMVTKFMKEVSQYEPISETKVIYDWNDDDDEKY